jgi:transketolase
MEVRMAADTLDREEIVRLAALATGDEKHEASSYSTLDALMVLYGRVLRVDAADPSWEHRDRFILSKGHGPAAYYAVLCHHGFFPESWMTGFMRQGGRLGGHPDRLLVPGVEASTGSLGHGLPLAVGVALALRAKSSDSRVVVLTGDAELNEGSNWEALITAPYLELNNLTLLVIDNASTSPPLRPIGPRLAPFGWDAEEVDGRDHRALERSLSRRPGTPAATIARIGGEPR